MQLATMALDNGRVRTMETADIVNVLKLAKVELDDGRSERKAEAHADFEKSCEAVELWLREIGALPPR